MLHVLPTLQSGIIYTCCEWHLRINSSCRMRNDDIWLHWTSMETRSSAEIIAHKNELWGGAPLCGPKTQHLAKSTQSKRQCHHLLPVARTFQRTPVGVRHCSSVHHEPRLEVDDQLWNTLFEVFNVKCRVVVFDRCRRMRAVHGL